MTAQFEEIKLDYPPNSVFDTMNEYRKKNLFCDVTLDISGTLFPCHRIVLTASSTYFQVMFNGNFKEGSLKTIPIQDIDAEVMEILLSAIYSARIRLLPSNAYFVLKASHLLQCDRIFKACVDCIIKNVIHMHYLPETCAFAKTIGAEKLYDACSGSLATTLSSWGKSDGFLDLSYDIFKHLLSKVRSTYSSVDEDVLALIIQWCEHNNVSAKDITMLLQARKFSKTPTWTSAMAELMLAAKSEDRCQSVGYGIQFNDSDLTLNLHLSTIDVKSGARGWGSLKVNESFSNYTLSNFQATGVSYKKFCTIQTKTYCLELNYLTTRLVFSCFEDNGRIDLQVPDVPKCDPTYEIIAVEKMIYLFHGYSDTNIWVYHCELDTWKDNVFLVPSHNLSLSVLHDYSKWSDVTFLDRVIYVVGCKNKNSESDNRYIVAIDSRAPHQISNCIAFPNPFQHEQAAVCAFDGKVAISGSYHDSALHNTFSIFDVTASKWRTDLQPMNEGRVNHKLIHRNGFIYAVERRPFVKNEKYDIKLNTWIEIPKLPKRVQFIGVDGVKTTMGIRNVIYAESIPL